MESKTPLIGMNLAQLLDVAEKCGLPRFAAKQMAQWLYEKRVTTIDAMTNLSKKARAVLAESYTVGREEPKAEAVSVDGTVKYLFEGVNGRDVESVYIPDHDRATLCVSSQAGCRMNCAFCMTGRQGFHGNLSPAGIINQILSIPQSSELTNIVFMGMGEPMDNVDAVLQVIEILTEPWGLAWSPKRITVSSIGKIKELKRLLDETKVHVAISIHSPFPSERAEIMPVERAYPITDVIRLLAAYDFTHQRRLSMEYIMWRGYNDDMRHAEALTRILRGLSCRVNLIRFHAIPGFDKQPCPESTMTAFRDKLNQAGITATIRASRGEDIMAACGMLAGKKRE
ncbi:MAG: 23S rRNA (adenine(2503)-C(2))-methyltransferase RlmN [Muribaculaceae bacterium]|nr:23S rRNA (adenine(2503)-C(2))-methyltransferase RlmN [Muribaculaceae bacterium]